MNKNQLADAIAQEAGLTKVAAKKGLDAFIKIANEALQSGDKVALMGFGTFSVAKRSSRTGRNPRTGQTIKIASRNIVKFKAGNELTTIVN